MPKSVNIPGVGVVSFPDTMSVEQINSAIQTEILPQFNKAPKPPVGQGGPLAVGLMDFVSGITDIPGGVAEILGQVGLIENPEENVLSKISEKSKAGWQGILGINPEAERTVAETGAGALGSVASFFVPGTIAGKVAKGVGAGAKAVRAAQLAAAGAVGAPLQALNEAENIRAFEEAGGVVTPGEKQTAILSNAAIGLSEIIPLGRFFGPLEKILAKVPLSKAGAVSKIMETGITRAVRSATEEGSQEAISQLAQNLVAKGLYNPDLDPTEGLLGNAAAGGFAGGTVDVILQLMAGRKIRNINNARSQLKTQIDTEAAEAAPELIRAQAIDGLNALRTAAPTGSISVIQSQMPGDKTAYYIVGADKKPIIKLDSIDAAIAVGKQYEADSNGATKFEPPTITELVKMKKAKAPKLTKAQKAQARQEAKKLKAAGQLQPAPIAGPATTPEGQATTAASIDKIATEDNLPASEAVQAPIVAPKKGRKKLAPVEPPVAEGVLPPTDTLEEISYEAPKWDEETKTRKTISGKSKVVDFGGRKIVVKNINGVSVPFYLSTGTAGKKETEAGKWYPFFGIGTDGWINKTSGKDMADYYGSPEFRKAAQELDQAVGDIRSEQHPKIGLTGPQIEKINSGLKTTENNARNTLEVVEGNIRSTIDRIKNPSAAPAALPAAETPPTTTEQEVPEGFRQVKKEIQPTVRVGLRPLNSTPEGAAKAAEMDAKKGRIADALNKVLSPIVAKDVRLNLVANIASDPDEKGNVGYGRGVVNPEGTVIDLALDIYDPALTEEQLIDKLTEVMNHEVIHTLTNAKLLTPAEITTLFNATDKIKYQGKAFTYFDRAYSTYATIESYTTVNESGDRIPNMDMITEEAVAEMFRDYRAGKLKIGDKPKGIFNKIIQFFKRMFRGFREAQIGEVFTRIESGEVGARERGAISAGAVAKFSVAPALDSDEFKRWWKDSKIAEDDGTPLVLYHGTSDDFDEFGNAKSGAIEGMEGPFYFSTKPRFASDFAMKKNVNGTVKSTETGRVIPVYISVQNPWMPHLDGTMENLTSLLRERLKAKEISGKKYFKDQFGNQYPVATNGKLSKKFLEKLGYADWSVMEMPEVQKAIRDLGYDGFGVTEFGTWNFAVFNPVQVKSIYNRFEPGAAESRKFSMAPAVGTEEFRNWFRSSEAVDRNGKPQVFYHGRPRPLREGQFNRGASGALPGQEGPYYFSPVFWFADQYATRDMSKGGDRKVSETGTVYPVFLSAQNPWDYNNPRHVDDVVEYIANGLESGQIDLSELKLTRAGVPSVASLKRIGIFLEAGDWDAVEVPAVQRAIRDLGFDGFYLVEEDVRNLAVFSPQQVKSIFNQFEPGTATSRKLSVIPRAAGDWATTGAPPPGVDSQNANGISPYRISQRRPKGTGAASSLTDDLEISTEAMRMAEKAWRHNSTVVLRSYNIMPLIPGESGDDTARRFVRHLADNLLFLHDMIPPQIRDRSKLWYDGARAITTNLAQQYNLPDSAVAAVIASESPQKDWYQNVSLAKRTIDIVKNNGNFAFSERMLEKAKELKSLKKYEDAYNMMAINNASIDNIEQLLRKKKGNMLAAKQMSEKEFDAAVLHAKALFVRIFDETYNSRDYNIISPEGNEMGIAKNKSGQNARVAWGSLKEIGKAISVVEDPSKENIDAFLGFKHKVRNFYNNIISPNAGSDITSDTHAVAAGFLKPFGGGAIEVHHNFGTSKQGVNAKIKNSGPLGVQGTYGLIADAYRLAASEREILPREMQSITWEAVRALFKPEMKRNKKFISLVNDTWSRYADGQITIDEARQKILEAANAKQGIDSPTWWAGPPNVVYEDVRETPDAGDLRQDELGGRGGPEDADSRAVVGDTKRVAEGIAKRVSSRTFGGENLDNFAKMANNEVRKAVRKQSVIPQPQPQSAFFQAANSTLFASTPTPTSPGEKLMDLLGGLGTSAGRTKIMDAFRVNYVQKQGQIAKYQRVAELAGKFESGIAEYSAIASNEAADRASHQIPLILEFGSGEVMTINNDPNSKYFIVNENETENAPSKVFQLVYTGGPNGTSLMDQFKTILVARAAVKRQKEGKQAPIEVTPEYIRRAEDLALQYPVLEDAYNRYQKFNRKMIKAAVDAGFISQDTFQKFTDDMNYYSLYREVGDETLTPPPYGATGRATNIQGYKGSEQGNLIADPMEAMIRNISFWTGATMRNIAAQKAHRVAMAVGIGRNLKWMGNDIGWESPDPKKGEDARYLSYNIDGKEFRYAVTDPLFATGLLNTEGHNMGLALELLGMPTTALREMVTRDPGFMIANLLRDSMSTWILAGSGASPLGTFIGLKKALMNDVSYQSLKRMGVVGSYDEAQKSPRQMVAGLKAKVTNAQGLTGTMDALKYGWDRLGKLSDASDAATRIAVYEAAIKEGATEYTAAYRALSVMNFSRRGASMGISVATKLIPFLNARIQGFDVLYTGIKAGVQLAQGADQTAFEKQRGAAVWYRGAGLMAAALALAMLNEDDEDYKELPPYVKDANFLIPVGGSQFISIPKPFEAGLIFGTVPTTMYDMLRGNRSTRSGIKLFTSQLGSTFGFNPMPQVALPLFENLTNSDFYTGMPLISPGMQKLDPSLQYTPSTSYVARGLGKLLAYSPFGYDFESGRFEGVSPIMIDNLITGYGGPIGGYVSMGIGGLIGAFGQDNQGIPIAGSNLPVIKRFFIDAQDKQPQAAAEAYEVYQIVDKATRTASRLKKMGDVEALKEFREENIDLLRVGKQVRKMAENLNNIRAQVRRLEVNTTMSGSEKKERMRELRAREIQLTRKIYEINEKLGR